MDYNSMKNLLMSCDSPEMRLEVLMDLGKMLKNVPDTASCTEIVGCSSFVQICRDGPRFFGRADSAMVRGIVAIIIAMVDGKTPDEIRKIDFEAEFDALNLGLGAGRLNGINSMIRFLQNL